MGRSFDSYVEQVGPHHLWRGSIAVNGTGIYRGPENGRRDGGGGNKAVPAHKFALARYMGRPIKEGAVVVDVCGERLCVNPMHLMERVPEPRTAPQKRDPALCANGHLWKPETTSWNPYTLTRRCLLCLREQAKRRRALLRTP